jgi:hypothetical protein
MNPMDVLTDAMLDAAERGDVAAVEALASLADDPEALAAFVAGLEGEQIATPAKFLTAPRPPV